MTFVQSTEETNQTLQDVGQFTNTTAETVQEDGASDVTKDTEHTTVKQTGIGIQKGDNEIFFKITNRTKYLLLVLVKNYKSQEYSKL